MSSQHVTVVEHHGKTIHIVGTAHVSRRSVEQPEKVIDEVQPDTVCVELDAIRYQAMMDDSQWRKLDIFQIIREKKVLLLFSNLVLSNYQRQLGKKLGVEPGAEMRAAILRAEASGAELVLADRDVQATLKRAWRNLSFWNKVQVSGALMDGFFAPQEIEETQIEALKDKDNVSEAMKQFAQFMPRLQGPLIDERDQYLMASIAEAPGKTIVAVVGAGHVEGMLRYLGKEVDREALSRLPPPSPWGRFWAWALPLAILGLGYYAYQKHQGQNLSELIFAWVLPTAGGSALLSLVAGARLLTVLVAIVGSPITTLHPAIGIGMLTGLTEAWLRRPTVADCEHVKDAMSSLRGVYRNRVTRVLLVTLLSSLGAIIGSAVGTSWILSLL